MNAIIDRPVCNFSDLVTSDPAEAEVLRGKVLAFGSLYGFLSQIIPYQDSDLEKLYVFLRHLVSKLPKKGAAPPTSSMTKLDWTIIVFKKSVRGQSACLKGLPSSSTGHPPLARRLLVRRKCLFPG